MRTLDPLRGELGKHVEMLRLIGDGLADFEVPFVTTIYSPLTQAAMLAGGELLLYHLRARGDRLRTALNIITENTLRFIDALRRTDIAGVFYVMRHASFVLMTEEEYRAFGTPYDLKILAGLPSKWWLNVAHLPNSAPMLELAATYPIRAINWDANTGKPDFEEARSLFQGTLCGGFCPEKQLHHGTPAMLRAIARETVNRVGTRRLILTAGDVVPVSAPLSNMRAARDVVNDLRIS